MVSEVCKFNTQKYCRSQSKERARLRCLNEPVKAIFKYSQLRLADSVAAGIEKFL